MIVGIWTVEQVMTYFLGDKIFFDLLPIAWVFDATDLFAIIAFLIFGIISSINIFRYGENDNAK